MRCSMMRAAAARAISAAALTAYRPELDRAETEANAKVAESLFRKATGEGSQAVTAAIFWLKTRARWKEPTLEAAMRLSTDDTITGLLHRIASHGRKLHDPG
jgi:hypothetical protein